MTYQINSRALFLLVLTFSLATSWMMRTNEAIEVSVAFTHENSRENHDLVKTKRVVDVSVPVKGYTSIDAAVVAASLRYNEDSIQFNREHVGGVLKCSANSFFFTHGVGEDGIAPVQFSIPQTKKCRLTALWHTHGGKFEDRAYFSPADTKTAEAIDRPIYMADYTGTLRVFHPGDRKMSRNNRKRHGTMMGLPRGTAEGRIVAELARGETVIAGI